MAATFVPNLPSVLRRDPILLLSATLTLAVAIGANTAVFSIANSVLVRPLPYSHPERIEWISERSGPARDEIGTAPDYYRIRENNHVFEDVAALNTITLNWTGVDRPEQLDAVLVSPSFFRVMGMQSMLGRFLAPGEEGSKSPPVAVLSYAFWRSHLGSDANIIGKTISLDRLPRTIIGVMPQGFDFPRGTSVWLPLPLDEADQRVLAPDRPIHMVSILARRKPQVSDQELRIDLSRLEAAIRPEYRIFATRFRSDLTIEASPLQEHLTGQVRPALLVLSGAAGLVLLIACVNLANLLLARTTSRVREVAVRLALGASRGRIIRQALTESLALAVPGGVAGIALAWIALRFLNAFQPSVLANYPPISMDWPVLAFTVALIFVAGILFGAGPALSAAGVRTHEMLKSSAATHSAGTGTTAFRKILVVTELGLSLILLIAAGLLARTFLNLAHTDLGFRSDHLLTFRVTPIGPLDHDYSKFYASVLDRLQRIPMARSAALLSDMPLSDEDFYMSGRVRVAGRPPVPFAGRAIVNNAVVSAGFFRTLGIPLKSGRLFDARDSAPRTVTNYGMASTSPVIVNEAFVRKVFPGEEAIGQRLIFGPDTNSASWTIIGVAGDIRGGALGADPPAMVYRCLCDGNRVSRAAFAIKTTGDPKAVIHSIEEQVHAEDHDVPVYDVKTMDERRAAALAPEEFQLAIIGCIAGIAILLAAAGVYGVVSYLVACRTREIGIRIAVGAVPADVLRMVLSETMLLVLAAIGAGLGGAWALTRYIQTLLYGVTPLDAPTFGLAPVLLATIVLLASWMPAHHASRIDPMRALREE